MKAIDYLILAVIAAILIAAIVYIRKQKKKGVRCIGCPDSGKCAGNCSGCSGYCGGCKGSNAEDD